MHATLHIASARYDILEAKTLGGIYVGTWIFLSNYNVINTFFALHRKIGFLGIGMLCITICFNTKTVKYTVISLFQMLGKGSFGVVKRGTLHGMTVAIKIIAESASKEKATLSNT